MMSYTDSISSNSSPGNSPPYCFRCDRSFPNERAKSQHLEFSQSHHQCECGFDGASYNDLKGHYEHTNHKVLCEGCCDGQGMWWHPDDQEYRDHLFEEHVCPDCTRHFASQSNLDHHRMRHLDRDIECYNCPETFKKYSHIIMHLDGGYCSRQTDLNFLAARCYQWTHYMDPDYRHVALTTRPYTKFFEGYGQDFKPYHCPECKTKFSKISGLFQHVESLACEQQIDEGGIGKLVRWFDNAV